MKKLLPLLFLLVFAKLKAQPYENSWIRYNQEYYKIKVWQTGIYRLNSQALVMAGLPVGTINPRNIQIYRNGIEQYIHVEGESDGTFDANDYIEFYGERNDGSLDQRLYADTNWQPNKRFSLFTDTAIYFLTVNPTAAGRRLAAVTDINYSGYSPSPYFIKETFMEGRDLPNGSALTGYNRGMNDQSIEYNEAEGWGAVFGNFFGGNYPISFNAPTDKIYSAGPAATYEMSIGGVNNLQHSNLITTPGGNITDIYYAQTLRKYTGTLAANLLSNSGTPFTLNVSTASTVSDYSMIYYLSLKYPHTSDLEGQSTFKLFIPDDANQNKSRYDFTNLNTGSGNVIFYDVTNHKRITTTVSGNSAQVLIDNSGSIDPKYCFLSADFSILTPPVSKINYLQNNPGYFNNFSSIAIDSAFIIVTHNSLWNEAQLYKAYRNITTRGKAIVIDIEELYDQFAYGTQKHPLSVRNFSNYILNTWPTAPAQHMMLIGKSIGANDFRYDANAFSKCLVASYGVPSSDILLTAGAAGTTWEPAIPIGRLSAKSGIEVTNYLQKVQDYETAQAGPPKAWMKEILHFGGGNDANEQALLSGYLSNFENIMEDSLFGGHVTTYLKFSNDPIVINQSDSLQAQIDSGVAVMTFFGHASGSGFDQSTDDPTNYRNQGRYPMIVANSCFAGNFHSAQLSVSERFVLEPQKAAIGFLASVGLGNPYYLNDYANAFFEHASRRSYGSSVGQLMKKAIIDNLVFGDQAHKIVCNEMSLQGDPAIKLNSFNKPDYSIEESGVNFFPSTISTDLDTFGLMITTRNFAKAVQDSFYVKVTRTYPNGTDSVFSFKRGRCFYEDKLRLTLNTGGFNSAGVNKIKVEVDIPDSVSEYNDFSNNSTTVSFFIISNDVIPIYPPKFAIHPYSTVTLKASTANPLAGMRSYVFQIDTLDLNLKDRIPGGQPSPLYRFTTIQDSGGVISWTPPSYILRDSTVYYWRVANDSIQYDTVNYHWQQSSFIYINGKTGFAQSHFHQFMGNEFTNVDYDTLGRKFNFVLNNKSLRVLTMGAPFTFSQAIQVGYYLNNTVIDYGSCQFIPAAMVVVLDSVTLEPWSNCYYNFGQANVFTLISGNCGTVSASGTNTGGCNLTRPYNYFIFRYGDNNQMAAMVNMINQIPNGNHVLIYSWLTSAYSQVNPDFYSALTSLGFNTSLLQDSMPYIFYTKKGNLSSRQEVYGVTPTDTISLVSQLSALWTRGAMTSEIIGPSSRWESLHWDQRPFETQPYRDRADLAILGLNTNTNAWDTLTRTITYNSGQDTTLNWIPASTYPYLRVQANLSDDSLRTPPQMKYWRIYYDEVPECAVNPNRVFSFYNNPLQEGDTLRLQMAIENIGNLPMDSLNMTFFMYDNNRARRTLATYKMDSLRVNNYLVASIGIDTTFSLAGDNSIWVEANPFGQYHQLEKYHFNNLAEVKFKVNRDNINPILDVTFDGVRILNGDIVSGKPNIMVQLTDENRYLALNDSTKFKVYITPPNSQTPQLIQWNTPVFGQAMRFTPANLPRNSCRIDWNPELTTDGVYTLEVEATDRSGNESGRFNYKIQFEVINRSTITEVLNYPNPFSTSTRFVFTLTGSEVPTNMKIQIMTVSGKIVREIMMNELGNIHIGRNITDYAWNGKDEFGDQLANGLYLYRVISNINGESIEKRETDIDKYFKKGWGKMYLMR